MTSPMTPPSTKTARTTEPERLPSLRDLTGPSGRGNRLRPVRRPPVRVLAGVGRGGAPLGAEGLDVHPVRPHTQVPAQNHPEAVPGPLIP